jgi:hypothetical protein
MKVRELAHWPPQPGGAYNQSSKLPFPEEAIISKVIYCRGGWLTFVCSFDGNLNTYDLEAGEAICDGLKQILEANVGKSLASIGEIELSAG